MVSPSPSFPFVSLFLHQNSTALLPPSLLRPSPISPLRHTASCSGITQHPTPQTRIAPLPKIVPVCSARPDARCRAPDFFQKEIRRGNRRPPDDPSELSDLQLHRRLRPGPPIEPEVSTACASLDTSIGPPCTGRHRRAAALQDRRTTG